MASTTVLLVEQDVMIAWKLTRAVTTRGLPRPQHVTNAQSAIEWMTRGDVGLCIMDYQLPDMSGVDLARRLRQRKPELPLYMISDAGSEHVAVAAFRAGVNDYFVRDDQGYDTVARVVQHFTESQAKVATIPTAPSIPEGMPPELLNPTYQNRLRVIGRQIDLDHYHIVSILEVAGGFLVRALPEKGRHADALEFPDRDFLHWSTEAYRNRGGGERHQSRSPLLPSGYEDFLRAIGGALDRHKAESISVVEFASVIVVGGRSTLESSSKSGVGNLQWILQQDDILQVLDDGYRRR
jgi:DNA-binding response OmpR family regulator